MNPTYMLGIMAFPAGVYQGLLSQQCGSIRLAVQSELCRESDTIHLDNELAILQDTSKYFGRHRFPHYRRIFQ